MSTDSKQTEVNRLIQRGIVFGVIWIMGIGSVIAITSAVQAKKLIRDSGGVLEGNKRATLSMLTGIAGLAVLLTVFIIVLIYRKH